MPLLRVGGMALLPSRRVVSATRWALGSIGAGTATGGGMVCPTGGSGCGTGCDGGMACGCAMGGDGTCGPGTGWGARTGGGS